ncbi:MAG TPA: DUF2255 family protein [Candidatus Limnocylindrales bacterium]|nr:DUF2255 family protein [Candidatus Limnocylindrales bacterium]
MNLSPEDRALLARTEEVKIETRSASGEVHRTIIWIVVDGDDVFVRSVRGAGARWYREALASPDVSFVVDRRTTIPATVVRADDPASIERCSAALGAKYAADPALALMLKPDTLPTTLRVLAGAPATEP